jgi:hypothetical protein
MSGDSLSGGSEYRRKLALNEAYVMAVALALERFSFTRLQAAKS